MKKELINSLKCLGLNPGTFNIKVTDKNSFKVTLYRSQDISLLDSLPGFKAFKLITEFKYPFTFLVSSK